MRTLRVMVVDDEKLSRVTMVRHLEKAGYESEGFDGAYPALEKIKSEFWDVVLSDLRMPTMDGVQFLKAIKEYSPDTEVVIMTAYGSVDTAVEAMRAGAVDYLTKPFQFPELEIRLVKLEKILDERRQLRNFQELSREAGSFYGIVGNSPAMKKVFEKIRTFGSNPSPLLITGETGTGKEIVGRALHEESGRKNFVPVHCAAIPRELAESELFGHEKGAFTSAVDRHRGRFEQAHRGTLFLDDVDDLPLEVQPKLLRVLQEGCVQRVGSEKSIEVNVRVIAASKKDLLDEVRSRRFREDLLYRLKILTLDLPPLRERKEDILSLAQYFLKALTSRDDLAARSLSTDASILLLGHDWPGNVRELQGVIEYAHAEAKGDEILPHHLPILDSLSRADSAPFVLNLEGRIEIDFKDVIDRFEQEVVQWALVKAQGNQQKAAAILKIPRTTFQSKLTKPLS